MYDFTAVLNKMNGVESFPMARMIQICLMFDDIAIPLNSIKKLLSGGAADISLNDARHILAYKKVIESHIINDCGYGITVALLDDYCNIYSLFMNDKVYYNFIGTEICSKSSLYDIINGIVGFGSVSDTAARLFYTISYNRLFKEYSDSISFLFITKYLLTKYGKYMLLDDEEIFALKSSMRYTGNKTAIDIMYKCFNRYIIADKTI